MKIVGTSIVVLLALVGLAGCLSTNNGASASRSIKIIRATSVKEKPVQRKIKIGKIEEVDYNSSVMTSDKKVYDTTTEITNNTDKDNMNSVVKNKVSSLKNKVTNRTNHTVNSAINNTLGKIFY